MPPPTIKTGTAAGETITADAGGSIIDALAGDDIINLDDGIDTVTTGADMDSVVGSYSNFNGDTIVDFSIDDGDSFVFEGAVFKGSDIIWTLGTSMFSVDRGSGPETAFTITGHTGFDVTGEFMAAYTGPQTVVSFQVYMPELTEMSELDASDRNGLINSDFFAGGARRFDINVDAAVSVSVNHNAFGYYAFDGSGLITNITLLSNDISTYFTGGADVGSALQATGITTGSTLSFFLISQTNASTFDLSGDVFEFRNTGGDPGNLSDGSDLTFFVNTADAEVTVHHATSALNTDSSVYVTSGINNVNNTAGLGDDTIRVGFEDGVDGDFNDVVFDVTQTLFL